MSRALRVAVVARAVMPMHGVGGLERSVRDLVRHLAVRGVEIHLITPPATAPPIADDPLALPSVTRHAVPYRTFPGANRRGTTVIDRSTAYPAFGRRAGAFALALAREGLVDVVHGYGAAVLGYAAASDRPVPFVLNPQGLEEFGATGSLSPLKRLGYAPLRAAVRTCARAADAIIATDASLQPAVERHLSPRPGQVRLIPNGIDVAEALRLADSAAGAAVRRAHGIGPGDTLLVSAGRLEFNKGFDALASALGEARRRTDAWTRKPWRWVLAGAGPYRAAIASAIDRAGIGAHVILAGRVSDGDLHAWYEAATLFVHPTRYEGSSLVTLEAMAHGNAVVATRAGGLPDKVRPGVNGWLVPPDDPRALAQAIGDALSSHARLDQFGARSRGIVAADFAWPVIADRHLALYDELVAARAERAGRPA